MDSEPNLLNAADEKPWVLNACVKSRKAGKVSLLACLETIGAVVLYWWIAIKWDTHWHLLSSVCIAPLLLLRSPESIKQGVAWFKTDWFGFSEYYTWSEAKRRMCIGGMASLSALATYPFVRFLGDIWPLGPLVLSEMCAIAVLFAAGFATAFSVAVAGSGARQSAGAGAGALASVVVFVFTFGVVFPLVVFGGIILFAMFWGAAGAIETTFVFVVSSMVGLGVAILSAQVFSSAVRLGIAFAIEEAVPLAVDGANAVQVTAKLSRGSEHVNTLLLPVIGLAAALGVYVRGVAFRIAATLRYLVTGFCHLPANWWENNFLVDSCVPAELMPGIRERTVDSQKDHGHFTSDGLIYLMKQQSNRVIQLVVLPLIWLVLFVPAFIYRLNIKATCWFWWPLAYLLKPVPKSDKTTQQKQSLCWPWDNRMQNLLILLPTVLMIALLIYHYCDPAAWAELKNASAAPIPLKLILGMEWTYLPPWHWALLIIAITGLGMLWIAGSASSHKLNHNWKVYSQAGMKRDLLLMEWLTRVRSLASIALMLLGLGMCLISFPDWRKLLPEPLLHRLESFYHTQELREQERLMHRTSEQRKSSTNSPPSTTPTSGPTVP